MVPSNELEKLLEKLSLVIGLEVRLELNWVLQRAVVTDILLEPWLARLQTRDTGLLPIERSVKLFFLQLLL